MELQEAQDLKNRQMSKALVAVKVKKRKPGPDYWRRVFRIAGALPFYKRLKIALRILKG